MAIAQIPRGQTAAKTAEEMVGENFSTFADNVRTEFRNEVSDLLSNRQLRQQLTEAWNQYLDDNNIRRYTQQNFDSFMSLKGSGIIERFISSEENREDFALLLSFKGEMRYNLTSGKVILTGYGSEARLENYLSDLEETRRMRFLLVWGHM